MLSLVPIFDGMVRAIVVTGKTCDALVGMQPSGLEAQSALDIVGRTDIGADATLHTSALVYVERFVGKESFNEKTAQYVGIDARPMAVVNRHNAMLTVQNPWYILA